MTYKNESVQEILEDEEYSFYYELKEEIRRIKHMSNNIEEVINNDYIALRIRDMDFVRIIPENDYVQLVIDMPYEKIVDFSGKCDVDIYNGRDGVDRLSFNIENEFDIQYGVSLAQQSYLYVKRLIL